MAHIGCLLLSLLFINSFDIAFSRSRFISYHMCWNTDRVYGYITQNGNSTFRYMTGCKKMAFEILSSLSVAS